VPSSTRRANLMNPKHLHSLASTRSRCPVCGQAVYSRAGIHPQCAMRQADPVRPAAGRRGPVGRSDRAAVGARATGAAEAPDPSAAPSNT
jgi:hypothetical protein